MEEMPLCENFVVLVETDENIRRQMLIIQKDMLISLQIL
jgi:hypothetical protein